ncbi:glycosyltransferase family 2 protein [Thermodesulfobacteriota bacterium]
MKISIITPSFNHAKYIEDTILSVMKQDYQNYEHLVIDGGSKDGTIDILKKYPHLRWISEKDDGQSNAINKGFRMSTGDIIAWINSDDYYENNIFSDIVDFFKNNKECYFLYGDITFVDVNKNTLCINSGNNVTYKNLLTNPDIVRQSSCFWKREILDDIGYLDESLHLIMDYDYFLRIGKKFNLYYFSKNLSYFRYHNEGKTSIFLRRQLWEFIKLMGRNSSLLNYRFCKFLFLKYSPVLKNKLRAIK